MHIYVYTCKCKYIHVTYLRSYKCDGLFKRDEHRGVIVVSNVSRERAGPSKYIAAASLLSRRRVGEAIKYVVMFEEKLA